MCHDKATVRACQYPPGPNAGETTPAPEGIDRRLVVRYGAGLLTGGYTAIPTYAWIYYARLGVSEAEMVLIAQLCTYWWTERAPHPGEAALAARMGKTVRTIQGYLRSLDAKGFLHIETRLSNHGQQRTNSYDLRPFFAAVEGLARLDGLLDNAAASELSPLNRESVACAEQRPLCAGVRKSGTDNRPKEGGAAAAEGGEGSPTRGAKNLSPQVNPVEIDSFDLDSIPPTPTNAKSGNVRFRTTASARDEGPQLPGVAAPADPDDADDQALAAEIVALSDELGDDAPRSSLGRARNLHRDAGVSLDGFLRLLDEAAARTRDRQASIVKRRRDGQAPNGMPYLFAVLQDLLHPAPPRVANGGPAPDRWRTGPPSRRRRRRADGHGEPARSYAAWSNSPEPLPIVEEHPVWRAVLDELAQVMTAENYNAWLASTRALDQEGELLRVAVPAAFNQTWLEHKLAGKVMGALQKIDYDALGIERVGRVEYVVDAAACVPTEATARAS
jgi:hypothetical protein